MMNVSSFWTLDRLAHALDERVAGNPPRDNRPIGAISTDTRAICPGDCFVALVGDKFDAHDFLNDAVAAGAAALVVSRPPKIGEFNVPVIVVDDTLVALGDLARYWRRAWGKPIVAVAGSNGKTTTKELIRAALEFRYTVHATTANFNNRVGVPLTLLSIPSSADIAVVEAGTSLPGEIAILRDIIEPDIAVVTCIAEEHLEFLGDLEGVLREESAIFDDVPVAITPGPQPEVAEAARGKSARVISAGVESGAIAAEAWSLRSDGLGRVVVRGIPFEPPVRGKHNLDNTMLAIAVALECGVSLDDAAAGIARTVVPPMRTAWEQIGDVTIINDAYNANPASMIAAIRLVEQTAAGQRVAILGGMRELGADSDRHHDSVAKAVLESGIELIAGVGDMGLALRRVGGDDARLVVAPDIVDLWPRLEGRLAPKATILLKASRGIRLERLLPNLTTWATSTCSIIS